ncbi:effector-associated constant component EACC1 [Streptomyces sp. P1-3]|uniref:effector-associated constant component EACC1 n=1 Tax=Streptomyces sp. P1-3 TaxID=3421658 RepID=UPI003D36860C
MECWLAVAGEDRFDAKVELTEWLANEPELRGRVRSAPAAPGAGELGGGWADALVVTLSGGGALTVLARTLAVYLKQPRRRNARVEIVAPDGRRTEVSAEHVKSLAEVEALLRVALHAQQQDAGRDGESQDPEPGQDLEPGQGQGQGQDGASAAGGQ